MFLTQPQLATLKTAIAAETDPAFVVMRAAGATQEMANFFNANSAEYVWATSTLTSEVFNVVNWKRMTPEASADETQGYANRAMVATTQLISLNILLNQSRIESNRLSIRTGIKDALSNLPTRPDNTNNWKWSAGGSAALDVMKRLTTKAESLYTVTVGTQVSPADLVIEGNLNNINIANALTL